MTAVDLAAPGAAPRRADVNAALLVLERMGLSPASLLASPVGRPAAPTFAQYVPVVAAVSAGTRRVYGSYWNRVVEHWGERRLDEPTASEVRQLMARRAWWPGATAAAGAAPPSTWSPRCAACTGTPKTARRGPMGNDPLCARQHSTHRKALRDHGCCEPSPIRNRASPPVSAPLACDASRTFFLRTAPGPPLPNVPTSDLKER